MDVGGRKVDDISIKKTPVVGDYTCVPCGQGNKHVTATKFCVECNENICERCVSDHARFAVMKGHQIMDTIRTTDNQESVAYPSQRCDRHGGKLTDVFCADHDFVGCARCIAMEHRSCVDVRFIPDMVSKELIDSLLENLDSEFSKLEKRVDTMTKAKQDCIKQLAETKEGIVLEIKQLRQKLNDKLDKMERERLIYTESFFNEKLESIEEILRKIKDTKTKLQEKKHSFGCYRDSNIPTVFVESKRFKELLYADQKVLNALERSPNLVSVKFYVNNELEDMLSSNATLGELHEMPQMKSLVSCKEFNFRLPSDGCTCEIRDVCVTRTGNIVLTDRSNNTVKLFDSNLTFKESIHIPGRPYGICEINDTRLAVALMEKNVVQFVIRNPLRIETSFKVGKDCSQIAVQNKHIYACCEKPGRVEVYDLHGVRLSSCYGSIQSPWYICIHSDGKKILISDFRSKIIIAVDPKENVFTDLQLAGIDKPSGIVEIGCTNQICVACFSSETIFLINEKLEVRKLLTAQDGISKPRSFAFDGKHSRLIVPKGGSDIVSVFNFTA